MDEKRYTAEQLANTMEFVVYKDLIRCIAQKDVLYTKEEMRTLLNETLGKEVR